MPRAAATAVAAAALCSTVDGVGTPMKLARPYLATRSLSVVIPALNEASRLPPVLDATCRFLSASRAAPYEVIVVDDGSQDATAALVRARGLSPQLRLLSAADNQGKGAALAAGAAAARGEVVLFLDADGATGLEALPALERRLRRGCHVAVGCRSAALAARPPGRRLMGAVFSTLAGVVVPGVPDTQCGCKLLSRRAARLLLPRLRVRGWAYDVELLAMAQQRGWRIASVPVSWRDVPGSKVTALTPFSMLADVARVWFAVASSPSPAAAGDGPFASRPVWQGAASFVEVRDAAAEASTRRARLPPGRRRMAVVGRRRV